MPEIDIDALPANPTVADLAKLWRIQHDCNERRFDGLEQKIAASQRDMQVGFVAAAKERAAIAKQVKEDRHASKNRDMVLDGGIAELTKTARKADEAALALSRKVDSVHTALDGKIDEGWQKLNSTGWKLVWGIGGIILTGVVAVVVNNVSFTSHIATKEDVSAHSAMRYTSADAAADRAAQDARDKQIMGALAAIRAANH